MANFRVHYNANYGLTGFGICYMAISMLHFLLLLWGALFSPLLAKESSPIEIALTFDDFPMGSSALFEKKERVKLFADKLCELNVQAAFFCIGAQIESDVGMACIPLVTPEHFLANHTYSHLHLSECSLEDFRLELSKTETLLSSNPNFRKWFRFPYLDYGDRSALGGTDRKRTAAFLLLRQENYQHGYVTINTFDWHIDGMLKRAIKESKKIDWGQLRHAYLSLLEEWIDEYHQRWSHILKRRFVHVLLLHQNDLNAIFLEDIVQLIRQKQWKIVSPEKAFQNPIPFLSKFANTKVSPFKGVASLSIAHIEEVLRSHHVFKGE